MSLIQNRSKILEQGLGRSRDRIPKISFFVTIYGLPVDSGRQKLENRRTLPKRTGPGASANIPGASTLRESPTTLKKSKFTKS